MSTLAELLQAAELAVAENADYLASGSIAKARAFHAAVSQLLAIRPSQTGSGREGFEVRYDLVTLRAMLGDVTTWLNAVGGLPAVTATGNAAASTVVPDFRNFRG
jgi:hypothetical protein